MWCIWAVVRLIALFREAAGAHILDGRALILPEHRQAVALALDLDPHAIPPLTPYSSAVFSPSGVEFHTGREGHVFGQVCHSVVHFVLKTMAHKARSLTDLLMVLDTLEFPL